MNTKPFFLPSEVARLVLGYLISEGFDQTSRRFLLECDCLEEFRKLKTMGLEYPTNILGLSLVEILDNFGFMKTQALERYNSVASTDLLLRDLDCCIDKLKYKMLQSGSNKLNVSKIRSQRKFPDRNVKVLPDNIGEMILKQGKILSSKQIAQTIKKVHETIKDNGNLKENHIENSSTDNPLPQNVNMARQDLCRAPSIPVKELPGNVEDEDFVVEIEDSAESNERYQNEKNDKHNNDGNREMAPADNLKTPCNTESISGTSLQSQTPDHHAANTADNLPTPTTSKIFTKQPDSGNPTPYVPTPDRQLSSSSGLTQTATVEVVVTAIPQQVVSVSLPSKESDSGCHPQPTESKPIYHSVGTQSEFPLAPSPSPPTPSSNKPCATTPLETIPSTSTKEELSTPSKSLPLIPESTPNMVLSPNANTLPSPMEVTPTSDELPVEAHNVSNEEHNQSTDSVQKASDIATQAASLSLSSSPPSFPSVYKTPVKTLQIPYRTPCKENSQSETLNTPTRDKNTSFSESLTPLKHSEADNAKSKRKRFPPEKRFVDIPVPGPSQVRSESGNSQDSGHLKDPIPSFVEKVISETSLPKFLAETINRKLYGEAKSEVTAKSSENEKKEERHKVECDKLMDEIMLTDFHMTKNDIDEVIHQTSSAGIPVLDDLLKLFASVSEEKDNLSDDECTEPVYDDVEFEGLDSCSESVENNEIKQVHSEDDLSKSDLKISENPCELSSLSKTPTTFLQVVDSMCLSEASTEPSSNQASEDLSQKSFSTALEDQERNSGNPDPKTHLASGSSVKDLQTSENINSSHHPKQDQMSSEPKEVSIVKHPSPCSRRAKVFSKGKSRKLVAAPVLTSPNKNPAPIPSNSSAISSFTPIQSPSGNVMPPDTHSYTPKSITTSLASDTHSKITTLTSESTNKTTSTSSDILIPISSSIFSSINTTPSVTSPTNLAGSSSSNTLTITGTAPVTSSPELPTQYTHTTTCASMSYNRTTTTTTTTTSTMDPALSILQANTNSSLLVQDTLSVQSRQPSKIISASISNSNSVVSRVIQPEVTAPLTKYPVMYIISPPNIPLQLQPSQIPTLEAGANFAYTNVQWSALSQRDSPSFQTVVEGSAVQQNARAIRGKSNRPRGRPKKVLGKKPAQPKIYNIAPNSNLSSTNNSTNSTFLPVNTEPQLPLQERETLAVSTDNSWTIEMAPGTDNVVLNLKSPHTQKMVSYQLTADQVKDHLASFIGTTAITEQILKWMKKLKAPKPKNRPNILSPRRIFKNKTPSQKIISENQPIAGESSEQTPTSSVQASNEPILYVAKPLGKIEDFMKRTSTETNVNKDSPKQVTAASSPSSTAASQVIEITDSPTSPVIKKSSPNFNSSLSKGETFAEGPDQKSPDGIGDLSLNLSKGVCASSLYNNSNSPKATDPLTKDNEFLAINILSTLCYSQSEGCTNADPSVNALQPKEVAEGFSFYDVDAASPAKCYKILMEGKKEGQAYAQPVDTPDKSAPVLQKHCGDKPSDLSDIIGYVSPTLRKPRKGTSEIKNTDSHFKQEDETLVSCKEQETGHKTGTKGSDGKTSFDKSPCSKTKKPTKRKLYEAEGQKHAKKINRTDIDLLLTRLHPDSLDGYD